MSPITKLQAALLAVMEQGVEYTTAALAEKAGVTTRAAAASLCYLRGEGLVHEKSRRLPSIWLLGAVPKRPPALPKREVVLAEHFRYGAMGSLGDASYMIIRQLRFPRTYEAHEQIVSADSDRLFSWDNAHTKACFERHFKGTVGGLEQASHDLSDRALLAFAVDVLKAETTHPSKVWTGYRILGTVNRSNGYPVYTIECFAKDPDSETAVYSGQSGANVVDGGWNGHGYSAKKSGTWHIDHNGFPFNIRGGL